MSQAAWRAVENLRHRRDGGVRTERSRTRTSAFVYGNITVLGALLALSRTSVESGQGSVVVAATALTTFLAHVVSERMAAHLVAGAHAEHHRETLRKELRDALPIATSGSLPFVFLLLAGCGLLPASIAQALAALVVVLRLAATALVVERVSGRRASATARWSGVVIALLGAVIAAGKAAFTH